MELAEEGGINSSQAKPADPHAACKIQQAGHTARGKMGESEPYTVTHSAEACVGGVACSLLPVNKQRHGHADVHRFLHR